MAKLARLVTNEVRLDGDNDIATNGESNIQQVALTEDHPVVLDVGAHYGEWSQSLLVQAAGAPVTLHAFEPSTHSASRARNALGDAATVHRLALSDAAGVSVLHVVHEGAGSNSLVPFTMTERVTGGSETIELSTVDAFCADQGIALVTMLKIDAEGHDLAVIKGARRMLSTQSIGLLQFEYNHRWIDSRAFLLDAFREVQQHGYRIGKVTPRGVEIYDSWHPEMETFREGNYLAWLPPWDVHLDTFNWWGD